VRQASRPSQARLAGWATLASVVLLGGCGGGHMAREPVPVTDLTGHWVFDAAHSDDAAKLIAAALPAPPRRPARPAPMPDSGGLPGDPGGTGGDGGNRGGRGGRGRGNGGGGGRNGASPAAAATAEAPAPAWSQSGPREFVVSFVQPADRLEIEQRPGLLTIGEASRPRRFEPGDEEPRSVTDRFGSRRVSAGWQHDEFIVIGDDGGRLKVVEHYRRNADDTLDKLVEFNARGIKALKVHARYRRATPAELSAPSEGPPLPAAH
jgi:hypothetical protein